MSKKSPLLLLMISAVGFVTPVRAQAPEDAPRVRMLIEEAKKAAGAEWQAAATFFCASEEQIAAMKILPSATAGAGDVEGQRAEPMKVFDNLYFVGQKSVATWAITTPDGIVLIDSGYPERVDDTLIPGLRKVGLDPANVKFAFIAHGHADHFGGAKALQDRFGTRIGMSAADWDLIQPQPGQAAGSPIPRRDLVLEEGRPIVVGGTSIYPVLIPGHTPGSMGFIFPVKDGGQTHTAALFGGSVLNPARRIPLENFQQYLRSLDHWREVTNARKVDVELMNHPIMDGLFVKLEKLKTRKPGEPHPLVVGAASYQRYAATQVNCMKAQIARREP
jgi:metallo-beta-lactamase class B